MIVYTKLWLLLQRRGMKRTDLREVVSGATVAKLGKNEAVSMDVISKICDFLGCQPGDIMENVTEADVIKAGETMNQMIGQMMDMLTATTGMSQEALLDEVKKSIPEMIESYQKGETDYIGLARLKQKQQDNE